MANNQQREEAQTAYEEDMMLDQMSGGVGNQYNRDFTQSEQGKLAQILHMPAPFKFKTFINKSGDKFRLPQSGDMPEDIFFDFWGVFHSSNALTYIPREKVEVKRANLRIIMMSDMFRHKRSDFTPDRNANIDQVLNVGENMLYGSTIGFNRIMLATQRTEQESRLVAQRGSQKNKEDYLGSLNRRV